MPKVSVLKLIDEAILPTVVIFATKIFGLLAANWLFSLPASFSIEKFSLTTPLFFYPNLPATQLANDLSSTLVYLVIAAGFGLVVFRSHHFHLSHLHPKEAKRIVSQKKEYLLADSFEIYHQAAIWLALSSFLLVETFLELCLFQVSLLIFTFALVIVFGLIGFLILDLGKEAYLGSR